MAAADDRPTTTEEWLYAGERISASGKVCNSWLDPTGRELIFKKLGGSRPGDGYAVEVIRSEDGVSVSGRPRYLAEQATRHASPAQVDLWRAETIAARQTIASAQAEKQAAEDDELQQALDVLRRHHAKLRSYSKKGAFTSYVIGELSRPAREPKRNEDEA